MPEAATALRAAAIAGCSSVADPESMPRRRQIRVSILLYWVLGLAVVLGCTIGGIVTAWPATMLVISPIVAMVYLGTPTMVTDLRSWSYPASNERRPSASSDSWYELTMRGQASAQALGWR
jgi:hypothetical protein